MNDNPFILEPYRSKELFCDREKESSRLIEDVENGRNVTLISPRRLGKTGLILRTFDEIASRKLKIKTVYADISSASNLDDFIRLLSEAVVSVLKENSKISKFFKSLGGIRPLISYNPVTGQPQLSITWQSNEEKAMTLKSLLNYLEGSGTTVLVAIDEFQQIREFQDVNMEALLRTYIQPLGNVHFIFSGSRKHVMSDMFTNAKSPFYESTIFMNLGKLDKAVYSRFITDMFNKGGKEIEPSDIEYIIEWTEDYTFYTQALCNTVFMISGDKVGRNDVNNAIVRILESNQDRFLEIRRLLTAQQWNVLTAVAREGSVSRPTATSFLKKNALPSGASVLRAINSLVDKEMLLATTTPDGLTSYSVYNVFLSKYLKNIRL
ncbi:MAG TPA: ATPase [Prevotella sp.]|nr:ATP-binding protein [Bacteroidales bacterium]MDY6384265.1 ATP-binding protein [Bacteroidales bacterium]HCN54092.1 ATPase [Prevotella sp.]